MASTREEEDDVPDGIVSIEFSTVRAERLKMFSDAVWSIIATVMIAPSMHMVREEFHKNHQGLEKFMGKIFSEIGFYFLAFLIICSTWASHVWTFQTMERVTDLSIILNLAILIAGGFLPYFYSIMTRFTHWKTVLIYCSDHIIIGLLQTAVIKHAFDYHDGSVLRTRIRDLDTETREEKRYKILVRVWITPAFAAIAVALSFVSLEASLASLSFILLFPWVQSIIVYTTTKVHKDKRRRRERRMKEREVILTERIRKGRIEAFNDGVYAITSTLILLDLIEKYIPSKAKVSTYFQGDVMNALRLYWGVILAYILTFVLIGLLWDMQLLLFKNLNKISRLMLLVNNWGAACVGVIPLSFTFIMQYQNPDAIRTGVRIGCLALFLTGFWNIVLYLTALGFDNCKEDLWIHPSVKPGGREFKIMIFELLGSPVCSTIVFSLTFLDNELIAAFTGAALVVAYAAFLMFWKTLNSNFCSPEEYTAVNDDAGVAGEATNEGEKPTETDDIET